MMLSLIFGMPHSYRFESWMWYFVEKVMEEGDIIDWAGVISDNLNEQLMNLEHTRKILHELICHLHAGQEDKL